MMKSAICSGVYQQHMKGGDGEDGARGNLFLEKVKTGQA